MGPMSGDSNDGHTPEDKEQSSPDTGTKKTLLGHTGEGAAVVPKPVAPAPHTTAKRRGKGKVTIPGGSPQRGQFWGKVSSSKTKVGLGEEITVPIAAAGVVELKDEATEKFEVADPITQELLLDEIAEVPVAPTRKAPPRRPPPTRNKPGTRPPPPKRESDSEAVKVPPSRPAPPLRDRPSDADGVAATPTPPRKRSEAPPAPPKRSEPPPAPPKRSEPPPAPPRRSEPPAVKAPLAPPKRAEAPVRPDSSPRLRPDATAPPGAALAALELEEVPLPRPALEVRSLTDVCRAELALAPEIARAARLHFELGQNAPDHASALKSYAAALEANPAFLPAIRAARALHLETGNMTAAAKLFAAEIALTDEPADKARLFFEEGCAWLDVAHDKEAARESYRAAAGYDPQNVTVLKALQHAELEAKDWSGLASALELEANAVGDRRYRAAVLARHARVLERRLRKPDKAIEQYELALGLDPHTPTALAEIKRLLFAQGRWQELIAAHEREASLTSDVEVKTQAHWSVARIYSERLGALGEAIGALEKAAELSPDDGLLLDELARTYSATGALEGAASAMERLAAAVRTPAERLSALHRLAEIHRRRGGKEQEAVRWYEAALAVEPSYAPALSALDHLYRETRDWAALARMYVAEGGSKQSSTRRALAYARAAEIFDTHLGRPDDAVEHFEHALALDPRHEGAFKSLVRLHTAAKRHRALIELYDRAVDLAPREEIAIAYMFKIGALYEDVLGEPSGATATYLRILERQPKNLSAIHAIQRTAETAGRYRDLADALDREVSLEKNPERLLMLQHRAAEVVYEHLGDSEGAITRLRAILDRDPKHAVAIASLAGIYDALGQPAELLGAYELELGTLPEGPARVALLVRMAELCEVRLGDREGAVAWYTRAVAADPGHALARAALVRLLRQKGDHKELARVLAEEIESSTDATRTARAALLLGEVYEVHLGRPVDAVVAYKRAVEAVPGHHAALEGLARVHSLGAAWKDLADVLSSQAHAQNDPRLATDAVLRAAALRADRLGRTEEAVAALDEIVSVDTNNIAALLALEGLHVEAGDVERLEALLTVEAEVFSPAGARVAAMVEQGRLLCRSGNESSPTLRAVCMGVLASEPQNPWALGTLEKLARNNDDRALLADVDARYTQSVATPSLLSFYFRRLGDALLGTNPSAALTAFNKALEYAPDNISAIRGLAIVGSALGDARAMVDAYRREAEFTRDDSYAADLLVQSAAVLARLGDRQGAIDDSERALARSPDHALAAEMTTALLGAAQLDRLIEQLSQAAHNARKVERKVALWCQVGDLYVRGKHDVGVAASVVKRALVSKPDDVDAMLQLARIYVMDAQYGEAAELLAKAVRIDDGLLSAHLELARIYTDHIGEARKARAAIDRVLRDEPSHRDALRMLLALHLEAGDRDEARDASERLLEAAEDDDTRAWALIEIARVELAAKSPERAAEALHEAVVINGIDGEAAKLYRRLAVDAPTWERYVETLRAHLDSGRARDPERAAAVYLEIARTQNARLSDPARAFRTLDEALDKVGDNTTVVLERAEMLAATGRVSEAARELTALVTRSPHAAEAWRGLTQVLQQEGRQAEAAIAVSPLVLLGEATEVEQNLAAGHAVRPGAARPGSFGLTTMRSISAWGGEEDDRAAAVFAVVADGIAKAFPAPYELYGVRKGDRIKPRTGHPMRNEVDRLAAVFGVEEVELYVHGSHVGDVALELSNPPSLMVPGYLAELPEAERVFLIARPLAAIASGNHVAFRLTPDETAMILAGAVRRLYPGFEEGEHDPSALAALQEKLAPSWFSRGRVDEIVQRYYAEPVDAKPWAMSAVKTATRAAALLAGDLGACLSAMRYAGLVQGDKPAHKLVRRSPLLEDLLGFWVSDEANEARRLAGLV